MSWEAPPPVLPPLGDTVHVWGARLDLPDGELTRLEHLLSDDERARASRLQRPADRRRFVAAHGILRRVLSTYTGLEPAGITLVAGPHGKPALQPAASAAIRFNMSHAGSVAAFAIASAREVGVDVEAPDRALRGDAIARRYFPEQEAATLGDLREEERAGAFLRSWVCKEAFAKALGVGLAALDVRGFALVTAAGESARLEGTTDAARQALAGWTLFELPPLYGLPAALVVQGTGCLPRFWLFGGV